MTETGLDAESGSLRDRFIAGMGAAACTVNIVTTDGAAGRAGVTVSAMASVSADGQHPTLLVCIHHLSPAARAIIENAVFCVNVLRADQSHISDSFAGRLHAFANDKFACTDWTSTESGCLRVDDALVAFDCRVTSSEQIGTHHVFIGAVTGVHGSRQGSPLIYSNRTYAKPQPLAVS
ncbi:MULTISPECIES: flavin reductase family protein [Rhizobium]|uniref:flavin reductase family protein n=1 Tax=Rhizobium TaxID=379 RepID=UPI001956D202|nr:MULTISPECIES: flavin reductase family protein [Rhizobium]MBM7043810.1 flavin reductase [Rhizobium lusitanum]